MPGSEMVLLMFQMLLLALTWELITNDTLPPWVNYPYAMCSLAVCINQYNGSPTCRYAKMVPNFTMIYDIIKQFYIMITDKCPPLCMCLYDYSMYI